MVVYWIEVSSKLFMWTYGFLDNVPVFPVRAMDDGAHFVGVGDRQQVQALDLQHTLVM